jgi:hypothetical protein
VAVVAELAPALPGRLTHTKEFRDQGGGGGAKRPTGQTNNKKANGASADMSKQTR